MRRYETFFDSLARNPSSPRIDAEILKWLPLMFIVVSSRYSIHADQAELDSLLLRPSRQRLIWLVLTNKPAGRDGFTDQLGQV